jgi:tricorn protease
MRRLLAVAVCAGSLELLVHGQVDRPLLRHPALSRTQIVFGFAGDLWIVPRDGGDARRLTSGVGVERDAFFSPDGSQVAFTGEYDGNEDVYVIPAAGGVPKRLTFHPGADDVTGWTPDGRNITFVSARASYYHMADQMFTVPAGGGFAVQVPLPIVEEASYSPDASHLAYVPHPQWQPAWKRYRGGQTTPIWIADLADSTIERIPRDNSNDFNPMWVGNIVYFLSDRSGPVSLFAYDRATRRVTEAVKNDGLDFKSASAGPGAIVIEQFGALKLFDTATRRLKTIGVTLAGDFPEVRPQFVKVDPKRVHNFGVSPSGVRAVMEAWGEIFTVPVEKGDIRNLTRSAAVAERDPAWSPDGASIAYFSDASGEYRLEIRDQAGAGEAKTIALEPSFYYSPVWSPDSTRIAFSDKRLNLWYVDVANRTPVRIDTDYYEGPTFGTTWAPDGKWIAYTKQLANHLHAVFLYSVEQKRSFQVTDGLSDTLSPAFDRNGKYLYFTASTDLGLSAVGFDMSSNEHPVTRSAYVVVLDRNLPSPLAPESDDEKIGKEKKPADSGTAKDRQEPEQPVVVKVDADGIGQRILALPLPARNYISMIAAKSGVLFLGEAALVIRESEYDNLKVTVQRFDLGKRKVEKFLDDINDFAVSADGEKILYRKGETWTIAGTAEPPADGKPKPGEGPLKLDGMELRVDPPAMWRQMFHEAWRIQRDFFYDPHHHGLDLAKVEKKYEPYLAGLASRQDLNYLLEESLGEMTVGHMFVRGGEQPKPKQFKGGLLGADYAIENGHYRVKRVYSGENWNPGLQAPLTQPGVNVQAGEYILSVAGRSLIASDDIDAFFEETAGRQVRISVGPNADGSGARDVTVVPVESEENLRRLAWIEGNRRRVDERTGGRVAYVYLPNTGGAGYSNFNRYYFAQVGRDAAIIDERFNEGGQLADYIVDQLRRPIMSKVATREGADWSSPSASIYGPKVMLVNEMAGSGGDALPWYFRKQKIGPIVGKRTWGGLIGIGGYPELIDGGRVTAPRWALYGLDGDWEVENRGISPDVEVDLDPAAVRQGRDPQLETAIDVVMRLLEEHPLPEFKRPAYPNYHGKDGLGAAPGK